MSEVVLPGPGVQSRGLKADRQVWAKPTLVHFSGLLLALEFYI